MFKDPTLRLPRRLQALSWWLQGGGADIKEAYKEARTRLEAADALGEARSNAPAAV